MRTLVAIMEESAKRFPGNDLLLEKTNGKNYEGTSYSEMRERVLTVGAGLVSMGIEKGDRIGLVAEGRKDWLASELGMMYCGAVNVPLSIKLDAQTEIYFRLKHSGARMVIVSWTQAEKVESIFDKLPDLEKIIYLDDIENPADHQLNFSDLVAAGMSLQADESKNTAYTQLWQSIEPNDLANISYTSGTTADPKGIMLSQLNYAANVKQANTLMDVEEHFTTLTLLPWDHSFAHTACLYSFMVNGAAIAAQEIGKTPMETLRNIPKNINEIKPTMMMSVPALSKSFRKNIEQGIRKQGATAEKMFNHALKVAYKYNGDGYNKGKGFRAFYKPMYSLYDKILFSKIRNNFGGNLRQFIGGGALLDIELQRFFAAIGMPVCQGYGLSEASPVISSNSLDAIKFGSSGKLVKYMDLKICDLDGKELPLGEKGEIVIKGENVMLGYWKNPEATADTIKDGWLHTGDMGYMTPEGFLYVLGRFKSLLIGNDGEKFSPEGIEESIVDQSSFIDQCMLYNEQNPYTSGMIVPNTGELTREIEKRGIDPNSTEGKSLFLTIIQGEIDQYKKGGKYEGDFPERWLPATIVVLSESFNEENQLLNSTMKMVRSKVVEYFAKELEYLYTAESKNVTSDFNMKTVEKLLDN